MSVVHFSNIGVFISHADYINGCYSEVLNDCKKEKYTLKQELFQITTPYSSSNNSLLKNRKRKLHGSSDDKDTEILQQEIAHVEELYRKFRKELENKSFLATNQHFDLSKNAEAANVAREIYEQTAKVPLTDISGGNGAQQIVTIIQDSKYLFPSHCRFYCNDVSSIQHYLADQRFDLIVLDPPWWNKFVRRKKRKAEQGYKMMYCDDLRHIPIDNLLSDNGILAVWCTNSQQHMNSLLTDIFVKWNVHFTAKLFWLKITTVGETVCPFASPNGKQPFEKIVLASKIKNCEKLKALDGRIVVSVPSALHSHKPPLEELLRPYLQKDPKCLEIFARYLLPNWTSYGLEVLRFQHLSLYEQVQENPNESD